MTFTGVSIVTLAEGTITELHVGLKGTMSALYLKDLAQKTHRGLEGRIRAGRYAGGLSPRTIARALNQANVPGSRGGRWTASLMLGNAARETGILRNRLYAGELV